jgi:hypothetical protein
LKNLKHEKITLNHAVSIITQTNTAPLREGHEKIQLQNKITTKDISKEVCKAILANRHHVGNLSAPSEIQ